MIGRLSLRNKDNYCGWYALLTKTTNQSCGGSLSKEKPYNGGQWTEARFNAFIKSALRSASQRWPPKFQVLSEAKQGRKINPKTGRLAEHYLCAACKEAFPQKEVEVNHITPVVLPTGFDSWDGVIQRLFCEKDGLEVLCKPCHKTRTDQENKERKNERTRQQD